MPAAPTQRPRGLAVFGGAFDPPHLSHRRLAEAVLQQLPVASLLVLPAGDHPHKANGLSPAEHRLAMCTLAFSDLPNLQLDPREIHRPGPSYTVDTLLELRAEFQDRTIYFLLGSDNLSQLPSWHQSARIRTLCELVVYPRLGAPIPPDCPHQVLAGPADAVSSTELRQQLARGQRPTSLAPAVADYALAHRLYRA